MKKDFIEKVVFVSKSDPSFKFYRHYLITGMQKAMRFLVVISVKSTGFHQFLAINLMKACRNMPI